MQQMVFTSDIIRALKREETRQGETLDFSQWYTIREILAEQYLQTIEHFIQSDHVYTQAEIKKLVDTWLKDHSHGNWKNNCGKCLYCIRKLLSMDYEEFTKIIHSVTLTYH